MNLFRKKNIDFTINSKNASLQKTLGSIDLILIGIGCIVGTGIFVVTGVAAAKYAGPAITISYLIAAIVCVFAALSYAEMASMIPVSGSAYVYSYVTMGEFVAWLVGWGLILEYGIGASTVACGWSGYVVGILKSAGIIIPDMFVKSPVEGGVINLPASLIVLFIGILLFRGTKEGVMFNRLLVAIKLGVIFLFLLIATPMVKVENWSNFMPFGISGVLIGAAVVFYAYIGFDAVATAAEECKNPKKDLPIGIIGSLLVCAILYIAVSFVLTGIVDFSTLNNPEPLAKALRENGKNIGSVLVAVGAVAGMTSVLLVLVYGQSRIFFSMSRDGLISNNLSKLHKKFSTPHISVVTTSIIIATIAGLLPIETLSKMTSIGTLFSFMIVAVGVLILRIKDPNRHRSFSCPMVYFTVPFTIISCLYLIFTLLVEIGLWFLIWTIFGLFVYFLYGYKHSILNKER